MALHTPARVPSTDPAPAHGGTRVLHVVPETLANPRYRYLGSTKDIRCRTEYFGARGIPVTELVAVKRSDEYVVSRLRQLPLEQYSIALFEFALYPKSLLYLKRHAPGVLRLVRPGNAQLLHQVDGMRVRRDFLHPYPWKLLLERTLADLASGRLADVVLSITEWETQHYWKYFVPPAKLRDIPYFVPETYEQGASRQAKTLECVCLTTAIAGTPFVMDATRTFADVVAGLGEACPEWRFSVTGDLTGYRVELPGRVEPTGFLDDIAPVMARAKAIALLSDYGYGFKTKVLDAIRYGAYVLVTPGLYERMPELFRPYLIAVTPGQPDSFRRALELAARPFPTGDLNALLRQRAYAAMDELFCKDRVG